MTFPPRSRPFQTLSHHYGEDAASTLYMWRFAGSSFGLERKFWWTLLASCAAGALTACGALLFQLIATSIAQATWHTDELDHGLLYDGTSAVPHNVTAYAAWGGGEWRWIVYTTCGGAVIAGLKLLGTFFSVFFGIFDKDATHHSSSRVFPRLTPNLVVEVGSLEGHMVHGFSILLGGAVAIGCGASVGPEAPNGSFGAGVGAGLHRLLKVGPREAGAPGAGSERGLSEEYVLIGMATAFVNIFPGIICAIALMLELNITTTIISVAAVKASVAALKERDEARALRKQARADATATAEATAEAAAEPTGTAEATAEARPTGVGRRAAGGRGCLGCAKDVAVDAKRSAAATGELPHSKFRFDFAQFVIFVTFGGSVGVVVYSFGASHTFLSADDLTSDDLVASTGASSADVFLFLLQKAWVVELWHYPVAMLFGVLGCGLALLGEVVGAVLQTLGLRLLCWLDHSRLNFWWTSKTSLLRYRLLSLCTARPVCDEVASLGALLQPILGGVSLHACAHHGARSPSLLSPQVRCSNPFSGGSSLGCGRSCSRIAWARVQTSCATSSPAPTTARSHPARWSASV